MTAVACAGSLQLPAMSVITCRAVGDVDGAMSAPVDPGLWRTLMLHATSIGLLRNASSMAVALTAGAAAGGLLSPAVFLKLATSGTGAVLAVATMTVDAVGAVARRRERERERSVLSMKLVRLEVGWNAWSTRLPWLWPWSLWGAACHVDVPPRRCMRCAGSRRRRRSIERSSG